MVSQPSGLIYDIIGSPCTIDDVVFSPALIEVDDNLSSRFPFSEFFTPTMLTFSDFYLYDEEKLLDALWVRARLPSLFGYRPIQIAEGRPQLLNAGFVAIFETADKKHEMIPFILTDSYCELCTIIISSNVSSGLRAKIANLFWKLIVVRGQDEDFRSEGIMGWANTDNSYGGECEVFKEVGLHNGIYYSECLEYQYLYDPDFDRPDYSMHQYQIPNSQRKRFVRRCV